MYCFQCIIEMQKRRANSKARPLKENLRRGKTIQKEGAVSVGVIEERGGGPICSKGLKEE